MNFCCPDCKSVVFKRNGYTRHGKQNHRCLDCGRQFSISIEALMVPQHLQRPVEILIEERATANNLASLKD